MRERENERKKRESERDMCVQRIEGHETERAKGSLECVGGVQAGGRVAGWARQGPQSQREERDKAH